MTPQQRDEWEGEQRRQREVVKAVVALPRWVLELLDPLIQAFQNPKMEQVAEDGALVIAWTLARCEGPNAGGYRSKPLGIGKSDTKDASHQLFHELEAQAMLHATARRSAETQIVNFYKQAVRVGACNQDEALAARNHALVYFHTKVVRALYGAMATAELEGDPLDHEHMPTDGEGEGDQGVGPEAPE